MNVESAWRQLRSDRVAMAAAIVACGLLVLAVLVPVVLQTDPAAPDLARRLEPPFWLGGEGGLFGADQLGRDVALRSLHGLRTSFAVAIFGMLLGAVIGTMIGLAAGTAGGLVDSILMRITDVQLSFPGLLVVLVVVRILGQGALVLILVLGLSSWMVYARVVRGAVLSLRGTELVAAIVGLGASRLRIVFRHILPNILPSLVSLSTLEFARLMLAEAALSFLGFGVQAPQISLGAILASGQDYLNDQWWVSTFAGLVLALAVLSTNLLGSWVQGASDPTRKSALP